MQPSNNANNTTKPFLIGITGGSGSGKSTFIRRLREHFTPEQVCIISMDDYYLPRDEQHEDLQGEKNFDLPKSFDKKMFRRHLQTLMEGGTVEKDEYVFNNPEAKSKKLTFHSAPVIIVEGLFVFHYKKIAPMFDLKVFISAKENLKVIRRIYRDRVERNYPLEDVLYKYEHHVLPSFEKYIEPHRENADIIINNNHDFERGLQVMKAFIHSLV